MSVFDEISREDILWAWLDQSLLDVTGDLRPYYNVVGLAGYANTKLMENRHRLTGPTLDIKKEELHCLFSSGYELALKVDDNIPLTIKPNWHKYTLVSDSEVLDIGNLPQYIRTLKIVGNVSRIVCSRKYHVNDVKNLCIYTENDITIDLPRCVIEDVYAFTPNRKTKITFNTKLIKGVLSSDPHTRTLKARTSCTDGIYQLYIDQLTNYCIFN